MVSDSDNISGFDSDAISDGGPIDFDLAQRLDREGSTCDVYVTRYHRRRVFVKRLKEKFRANSVYRAALDKEFELGVGLHHKSLPEYREYHDDYIVMDYIDGVTLAKVIKSDADDETDASAASRWLRHPDNLKRMLKELIEVTGYLHRHNIVHCDIKPDNVILTDGTFNLMLIDFDKSYTSWLDDTSGSPSLYGVAPSRRGDTDIDFHGIGKIIDALIANGFKTRRLARLRDRCFDSGVTAGDLLAILDKRPPSQPLSVVILIAVVLTSIGLAIWLAPDNKDNIKPVERLDVRDVSVPVDTPVTAEPTPQPEQQPKPTPKVDVEALLSSMFQPLYDELDSLEAMIADTTLTADELYDSMMNYLDIEKDCHGKAYKAVNKARNYSDTLDGPKEVWQTKAWSAYMHYSDSIQRLVSNEWRARIPKK